MTETQMIERTSIVMYQILDALHQTLSEPGDKDEVTLGMIMGLAMFLDEKIGPFRAKRLMEKAPTIVLKADAHVTDALAASVAPVVSAFGEHLVEMHGLVRSGPF